MSLTFKIIIGMISGLVLGVFCQLFQLTNYSFLKEVVFYGIIDGLGNFYCISKMMVVPLVFFSDLVLQLRLRGPLVGCTKQFRYIYSPLLSRSQLSDLLCSLIREKEGVLP